LYTAAFELRTGKITQEQYNERIDDEFIKNQINQMPTPTRNEVHDPANRATRFLKEN
jgi:hypothetical protein